MSASASASAGGCSSDAAASVLSAAACSEPAARAASRVAAESSLSAVLLVWGGGDVSSHGSVVRSAAARSRLPLCLQRRRMQGAEPAAVAAGAVGDVPKLAVDTGSQAASHLLNMEGELLADTGQSFHHLQQRNCVCLGSKRNKQVAYKL